MTRLCDRQWMTTAGPGFTTKLHSCPLALNHAEDCVCPCGARLGRCLPLTGTREPAEIPTRKPSEILADRATRQETFPRPGCA